MKKYVVVGELIHSSTIMELGENDKLTDNVIDEFETPHRSDYYAIWEVGEDGEKNEVFYTDSYNKVMAEYHDLTQEYICVDDYEGGSFHVGDTKTAEEWKEWALSMNEIEESENYETFKKLPPKEAMNYVADMWQIEIVPYDENNEEHKEMRKEWEEEL